MIAPAGEGVADKMNGRMWMEYLTTAECWDLLSRTPVGRIGVLVDSAPEIYPINHVVDGETLVFRTDDGSKLHGIDRSPAVCFEVDEVDGQDQTGWSVVVKGRAHEIDDAEELRRVGDLPLELWSVGVKPHWIRIVPTEVSGRRIDRPRAADPAWPA